MQLFFLFMFYGIKAVESSFRGHTIMKIGLS